MLFLFSVTELEMRCGLLTVEDPSKSVLVFHRQLRGMGDLNDKLVQRHIDCVDNHGKVGTHICWDKQVYFKSSNNHK